MSYSGTVRCSNCYTAGHNRNGCPKLRKAFQEDPNSYEGRQWARIQEAKAAPKTCSYCSNEGHTRAGCADLKIHKQIYQEDATLFRHAIAKWMRDTGLGIGALIRAQDVRYYNANGYSYPGDPEYIPPVGMVMNTSPTAHHYAAISGSNEWQHNPALLDMQGVATGDLPEYRKSISLSLPCIPGLVPRLGIDMYGRTVDRLDRTSHVSWEVVSPGFKHFDATGWTSDKTIRANAKAHFSRDNGQEDSSFKSLSAEQRVQLRDYVNGNIDLSEMKDTEVPQNDS